MKFDLVSDIHTDLWTGGTDSIDWIEEKNEGSEVLVLAGDTSNFSYEVQEVVRNASEVYDQVVFVDGNHEHYFTKGNIFDEEKEYEKFSKSLPNVTFLNKNTTYQTGNTLFVGANGWYDFRAGEPRLTQEQARLAWAVGSNDPRQIDFGVDAAPHNYARIQAMALAEKVAKAQNPIIDPNHSEITTIVVVTHTAPRTEFVGNIHFGIDTDLDGAYCNTEMDRVLKADTNNKIKVWCFGHTHTRLDRIIDGVRYINNSRGYESERSLIGHWFVAQIDTEDEGYGF